MSIDEYYDGGNYDSSGYEYDDEFDSSYDSSDSIRRNRTRYDSRKRSESFNEFVENFNEIIEPLKNIDTKKVMGYLSRYKNKHTCQCSILAVSYIFLIGSFIIFLVGYYESKYFDNILSYFIISVIFFILVYFLGLFPYYFTKTMELEYGCFKKVGEKLRGEFRLAKREFDENIDLPTPGIGCVGLVCYFIATFLISLLFLNNVFIGRITQSIFRDAFLVFLLIFSVVVIYFFGLYLIEVVIRILYFGWIRIISGVKTRLIISTILFSVTIWTFYTVTVYRFQTTLIFGIGYSVLPGLAFGMIPAILNEIYCISILLYQILSETQFHLKVYYSILDFLEKRRIEKSRKSRDRERKRFRSRRKRRRINDRNGRKKNPGQGKRRGRASKSRNDYYSSSSYGEDEYREDYNSYSVGRKKKRNNRKKSRISRKKSRNKGTSRNRDRKRNRKYRRDKYNRYRKNIRVENKFTGENSLEVLGDGDFELDDGNLDRFKLGDELESELQEGGKSYFSSDSAGSLGESDFGQGIVNSSSYDGNIEILEDFGDGNNRKSVSKQIDVDIDSPEILGQDRNFENNEEIREDFFEEGEDDDFREITKKNIYLVFRSFYLFFYCVICSGSWVFFIILLGLTFTFDVSSSTRHRGLLGMTGFQKTPSYAQDPKITKSFCVSCQFDVYIYRSKNSLGKLYYFDENSTVPEDEKVIKYYEYEKDGKKQYRTIPVSYPKKWKMPTVNLKNFVNFGSIRQDLMNFDSSNLPRNGIVFRPRDEKENEKRPLVMIMHGYYPMMESAEEKFIWLGNYLASRGYIAVLVDLSFFNFRLNFFPADQDLDDGSGQEFDGRALMLLYHLQGIRDILSNCSSDIHDPNKPCLNVDWEKVSLIGHSRGGQSVMIVDALKKLKRWPRYGIYELDSLNFDISSYVTLSPTFKDYFIHGEKIEAQNINHLMIWGGRDTDVLEPEGLEYFSKIKFNGGSSDSLKYRKCFVYVDGGNHGHYASTNIDTFGLGKYLTSSSVISYYEQMEIAKTYIGAFLHDVFTDSQEYTPFLRDPREGKEWFPLTFKDKKGNWKLPTYLITQYEDNRFLTLSDFTEDIDVTTTTYPGGEIKAKNFVGWAEGKLVSSEVNIGIDAAFLRITPAEESVYSLDFSEIGGVECTGYKYLSFQFTDVVSDRMKGVWENRTLDRPQVKVVIREMDSDFEKLVELDRLPPREYVERVKFRWEYPPMIMQSYFIDMEKLHGHEVKKISHVQFAFKWNIPKNDKLSYGFAIAKIGLSK